MLSRRTEPMEVGGRVVRVLAPAPRAVHLALHAAQHSAEALKSQVDLKLAIEQLPEETWREAVEVARELEALPAFAAGLLTNHEGAELAERLGVSDERSVEALLAMSPVPLAQGFNQLATTPGLLAKLRLVLEELFPSPTFMRWWSPLAKRGPIGLAAAYLWRPVWFALRAGPGFLAWRKARRGEVLRQPS